MPLPPPPSTSTVVNNRHVLSNYVAPPPTAVSGDIAGTMRVSGILLKWVNCAKGWRPRWFLLQDGVLSYYKIHGPDKIVFTKETDKGCRVIGSRLSHNRHHVSPHHLHRKPLGELHLKVSSIHESRSDDRRFSIFTGTKKLHLKAKTQEDQMEWLEALQAVKRMFPRMSNSELMNPIRVSTEKLRERLLEEGVNEAVIQETERIMRSEFSEMQDQLVLLRKKVCLLIDTLQML
ncbi:hypothetical protein L6452_39187 [Arctium lappa]|uniref:Uncharacterized protein n=1 Tax=Arctium lappa TaxID=4217 RepID=A0ACB8XS26_ARCLA|nr:hypothetical protein L6452_39187 [Arctium lappa]